ncbi:MAG: transcriptional regulator, partial [bacterium]|nr:transcriptional regulator [bacterium]
MSRPTRTTIRFGPFEADFSAGQLWKNGLKIKIQEMPLRVLACLLERPGDVVTREELREKLWAKDEFVEFEHSLNTAVNKLRSALGDQAEQPRYIETIPRRGYRFIGTVDADTRAEAVRTVPPTPRRWPIVAGLGLAVVALVAVAVISVGSWLRAPESTPGSLLRRFAFAPEDFRDPVISPDGRHIAYVVG